MVASTSCCDYLSMKVSWLTNRMMPLIKNRGQTNCTNMNTHTHTYRLMALSPGLPGWAGTSKVKPIWILLKQETVSGSGISWAICKSAPRSRQITTPTPHRSVFFLRAAQPTASKHSRHRTNTNATWYYGSCIMSPQSPSSTQIHCYHL